MIQTGSYNIDSFATNREAEIRRLNAQVDLFWSMELALLKRYGLQDNMEVLDCGCGPGRLIELLKGQMPGLRCTGLEMDKHLMEAASNLLSARGISDCRIVQGTAEQPGLSGTAFDFIIMRLVLEHVPDPVLALSSLKQLLRPGGRLVVISNDFDFHLRTWPPVPQLDRLYDAYCASRRSDGGDPCIGRRLPRLFAQAGLKTAGYEIEVAHNAILGDQPFLKAEGAGIPAQLVKTGFLDQNTLEEMTRTWQAMLLEPEHSIMRPLFVGIGERAQETEEPSARQEQATKKKVTGSIPASPPLKNGTAKSPDEIVAFLLTLVAEVMEHTPGVFKEKQVGPEDILTELGLDSLAALDLQAKIKSCTGMEIPIVKLLDNITVRDLAAQMSAASAEMKRTPKTMDTPQEKPESVSWEEGEI